MHGQEREIFGDQAYWSENQRQHCHYAGIAYRIMTGYAELPWRSATAALPVGERAKARAGGLSDSALLQLIKQIHAETTAAYGSPRIFHEIQARGHPVSEGRVERLMPENDIRARLVGRGRNGRPLGHRQLQPDVCRRRRHAVGLPLAGFATVHP